MFTVLFFESERGEAYVETFIRGLDVETSAKVVRMIALLELCGPKLRMPYSRSLGSGLFELRTRGNHEIRIFYIFLGRNIYLLHAIEKKTQTTPRRELVLAWSRAYQLMS